MSTLFYKNVFSYSVASFYAQCVRFVQELVVRLMLTPEVLGLWSLVLVIQNFGTNCDIGVLTAAGRELPILYGAKQYTDAANYRTTVLYLQVIGKLLVAMGILIYALCRYLFPFQMELLVVIAAAAMVVLSSISDARVIFYQSAEAYVALSKKLIVYWTCYALMLIMGVYIAGVKGLIIAALLAMVLQVLILRNRATYQEKGTFTPGFIKPILKFALPFRMVDFPMSMALVVDGLFVAKFFSLTELAIYTTAKLIFNQAGQVPTWIGSVFIVRLTTLSGSGNKWSELGEEMLRNLTAMNLIVLPIVIGAVSLISHWGIMLYLPQYDNVIILVPILLISLYFQPRVTVLRNYWIIEKKFGWLAVSNLIGISLMLVGFAVLCYIKWYSLIAVSLIFTAAFACYFVFVLTQLGLHLWGVKKLGLLMAEIVVAICMLLLALTVAGLFNPGAPAQIDFSMVAMSILKFFIVMAPLVIYGIHRLDMLNKMLMSMRSLLFRSRETIGD
jgi:O-antigen/teichoic acid export membrane protein